MGDTSLINCTNVNNYCNSGSPKELQASYLQCFIAAARLT